MMLDLAHALMILAAGVLMFAALHDIAFRTIPNWVSAALVLIGGLMRILDHRLVAGIGCAAAVFLLALLCWTRGWLGGGDVKLLGAATVLTPPSLVPEYVTMVALTGGGLALIYLLLEQIAPALQSQPHRSLLWRVIVVECRRIRRRASLPYATAIGAAALLTLAGG